MMLRISSFFLLVYCLFFVDLAAMPEHKMLDSVTYKAEQLADKIIDLYNNNGYVFYNHNGNAAEVVTEMSHALQSAKLATNHSLTSIDKDSFIASSLMHDIGHLLFPDFHSTSQNDHHDKIGADFLEPIFGREVSEPIRLHVMAKRYLCTVDKSYFKLLTPASQESFVKQGKKLSFDEIKKFSTLPFYETAIEVRKLDDQAKDISMKIENINYYRPLLIRLIAKRLKSLKQQDQEQVVKKAISQINDAIEHRKLIGR